MFSKNVSFQPFAMLIRIIILRKAGLKGSNVECTANLFFPHPFQRTFQIVGKQKFINLKKDVPLLVF